MDLGSFNRVKIEWHWLWLSMMRRRLEKLESIGYKPYSNEFVKKGRRIDRHCLALTKIYDAIS